MGLFRKKEEPKKSAEPMNKKEELPFKVQYSVSGNGMLQVDFKDKYPEKDQHYECTRLIIDPRSIPMKSGNVNNALVSWYNTDDTIRFDRNGQEDSRRANYSDVLVQLDTDLLVSDPNYCYIVMKYFLKRERVQKYLSQGLEENPERPCGRYIGGVEKVDNGYRKRFYEDLGKEVHYSEYMNNVRREYRENCRMALQNKIDREQEEINKQQEIINQRQEKINGLRNQMGER